MSRAVPAPQADQESESDYFPPWLQKSGLKSQAPPSCSEMNAYPALGRYGYTVQATSGRDNGTVAPRRGNAGKNLVLLWLGVAIEYSSQLPRGRIWRIIGGRYSTWAGHAGMTRNTWGSGRSPEGPSLSTERTPPASQLGSSFYSPHGMCGYLIPPPTQREMVTPHSWTEPIEMARHWVWSTPPESGGDQWWPLTNQQPSSRVKFITK